MPTCTDCRSKLTVPGSATLRQSRVALISLPERDQCPRASRVRCGLMIQSKSFILYYGVPPREAGGQERLTVFRAIRVASIDSAIYQRSRSRSGSWRLCSAWRSNKSKQSGSAYVTITGRKGETTDGIFRETKVAR
jgi:hypothetical protein